MDSGLMIFEMVPMCIVSKIPERNRKGGWFSLLRTSEGSLRSCLSRTSCWKHEQQKAIRTGQEADKEGSRDHSHAS